MRPAYETSVIGVLPRMFIIFPGSVIGGASIIFGLLWVGLSGMA